MSEPLKKELLSIPSSLDELERVDAVTGQIATEMGFDDNALADLGICVTEAVTNAIAHAHKYDESLSVDIEFLRYDDALKVRIRDHGPGFNVESLPDPTLPENLLKDHGRGVLLIRALMDDVGITRFDDGMMIEMVKKLNH